MGFIDSLNWRYATKSFDPSKKLSSDQLNQLQEAIRLSASAFGLQAYKILIIEDQEIKNKLREASWNQSQVSDASHVFVFCSNKVITDQQVEESVVRFADTRGLELEKVKGYGDYMKNHIKQMDDSLVLDWNAKQTYIAATNLMAICAELEIDSCPMEGFEPNKYDQILGLEDKNLTSSIVVPVGFRSTEDKDQHAKKVRKTTEELFETV